MVSRQSVVYVWTFYQTLYDGCWGSCLVASAQLLATLERHFAEMNRSDIRMSYECACSVMAWRVVRTVERYQDEDGTIPCPPACLVSITSAEQYLSQTISE